MKLLLLGALFASLYYFPFYTVGAFVAFVIWVNFFRKPAKDTASSPSETAASEAANQNAQSFGKRAQSTEQKPQQVQNSGSHEDWDSVFDGNAIPISVKRADGTTETQFLSSGEKGKEQLAALLGQKV